MIYKDRDATLSIRVDIRLMLSLIDRIMEEDLFGYDTRRNPDWCWDTLGNPREFRTYSIMYDVSGIVLGLELIDPIYTSRPEVPTDRRYRLIGAGWDFSFRFTRDDIHGESVFTGKHGFVNEPTLAGSLDAYRGEMTLLKLFHDIGRRYGNSKFYPMPREDLTPRTMIDAWHEP